jgi:hypothetical protein
MIQLKSERLNQMKLATSVSSETYDIASIRRYFGLEKDNVKHIRDNDLLNGNYKLEYSVITRSYECLLKITLRIIRAYHFF